ncbi:MAG: Stk1 family PASTA domain-containing Ser/Thr kinase [Lachnospiraceae bacterium]|nr:Stk1 family PASTA domain-containing Ser/Thr kinase [Lachnospiraceae bacterium]
MAQEKMMLSDRYEIISKIGSGGMSDVYKAIDGKLNRYVAVKVLKAEYAENTGFVSKFRAEAQSAAGLMHPNIVNVYDVGEDAGLYYIVMELVEGITLKHYIEKKLRLSFREAVSIAIQVSMGIESAHNNHIIHRDIKPQNIIISKEGKVKVTDFGIARAASSDTITSNVMGSVHYTSPEQARGGYSDEKSDIYSLGIVIFEMLTGRVPFDGDTAVSIAIKHIQEDIPNPREYVDDIPVSVEHIIYKCCEKNPDRRYSSMAELVADLKRSLVSPDDDFVQMIPSGGLQGATKMITDDDVNAIRQQTGSIDLNAGDLKAYQDYDNRRAQYPDDPRYEDDRSYDRSRSRYEDDGAPYVDAPYPDEEEDEYYRRLEERDRAREKKAREDRRLKAMELEEDIARSRKKKDPSRSSAGSKSSKSKKTSAKSRVKADKSKNSGNARGKSRRDYDDEYDDEDDDDDMDPGLEKLMTVLGIVAAIIIVIIIVVLVGRIKGLAGDSSSEETQEEESSMVEMINVSGVSFADAKSKLEELGLEVTMQTVNSSSVEKGNVINVTNEEGKELSEGDEVESGSAVIVNVSNGDSGSSVPDIVGKSKAEAKVALENAGFVMEETEAESEDVAEGNVISQSPAAGEAAEPGSTVKVMISSGKPVGNTKTVPDLKGMTETAAKTALTATGLSFANVTEANSDTVAAGLVISQSPEAGSSVEEGASVDFVISLGPAIVSYAGTFNIAAPPDYTPGSAATLLVTSNVDNSVIYQSTVSSFPAVINITGTTAPTGTLTVSYTQVTTAEYEADDGTIKTATNETPKTVTQALTFTPVQ